MSYWLSHKLWNAGLASLYWCWFSERDRGDRAEQNQRLLFPRLSLQSTGDWIRSPYYLYSAAMSAFSDYTTPSPVFYLEVGWFSLRSKARLGEEKSRLQSSFKKKKDFSLLLKNFIHFSSQFWSERREGLPDDKVFITTRNNPGEKLSLLYCLGGLREDQRKRSISSVLLFGIYNHKVVQGHFPTLWHNTYIHIFRKITKCSLKNYAVIRFLIYWPRIKIYLKCTFIFLHSLFDISN